MTFSLLFLIPILCLAGATSPTVLPPSRNPFKNIYNSLSPVERDNLTAMTKNMTFAPIKQLLDSRFATLPQDIYDQISAYTENNATSDLQGLMNTDLKPDEKAILDAYVNATAFEKINAFWQAKVLAVSADDRLAIEAYLKDKQQTDEENRNFLSKFFHKVKNFFWSEDKKKTCNSATDAFSPLLALTADERKQLNAAIQSGNLAAIGSIFDQKLRTLPQNVQDRINKFLKDHAPSAALVRINNSLNSTTEHGSLLAQWKQTGNDSSIKEFWKRKIEALGEDDQDAIKSYFEGVDKDIGDCFTRPAFYKPIPLSSGTGTGYIISPASTSTVSSTNATSSSGSTTSSKVSSTTTSSSNGNATNSTKAASSTSSTANGGNGTTLQQRSQG